MAYYLSDHSGRFLVLNGAERVAVGDFLLEEIEGSDQDRDMKMRLVLAAARFLDENPLLPIAARHHVFGETGEPNCVIDVDDNLLRVVETVLVPFVDEYARPALDEPLDPDGLLRMAPGLTDAQRAEIEEDYRQTCARWNDYNRALVAVNDALPETVA